MGTSEASIIHKEDRDNEKTEKSTVQEKMPSNRKQELVHKLQQAQTKLIKDIPILPSANASP